jgi:hypothetical protein
MWAWAAPTRASIERAFEYMMVLLWVYVESVIVKIVDWESKEER